jgi:hypothetical protein
MTKEEREKLEVLQFIGGTIGALKELDSKILSKHNPSTKITGIDINRVQRDLGNFTPSPAPVAIQQPIAPPINVAALPSEAQHPPLAPVQNDDQLLLDFDKKYSLNDIFDKINTVYLKICDLEKKVESLEQKIDPSLKKS